MTALNWVTGPLAVVLIVVLFGSLAFGGWGIAKVVRLGGADPTRRGPLGGRLKTMLTEILGHTRMLKWGFVGVAHWFVMVGFGALVLTLAEAVGETWNPAFELPWLGHQAWYGVFVEVIAATTVAGSRRWWWCGSGRIRVGRAAGRGSPGRTSARRISSRA